MPDPMREWLPDSIRVIERGWLSSNNIVFRDPECATVVDTGYVTHGGQTLSLLAAALDGLPLRRIINTHLHSDHAGGNALLQARHPDCQTWIPPGLRDAVDVWDEARLSYTSTGQQCPRFRYDQVLSVGQIIAMAGKDWRVLPAPGHDPHMVMLWCERLGILISADALWQNGFGIIFPELDGESGFVEQKATLDLITQLSPRVVIPGHGAPFTEVDAALRTAHDRIDWLAADPRRNADNAIKALLAFKLLETTRLSLPEIARLIEGSRLANLATRAYYPEAADELAERFADQLVRAGVAMRDPQGLVSSPRRPPR